MRNLKRALSLGLTAAMISGLMVMGSSAASSSYTDVADTDNVEAIEVLKAVGIMIGDEDGNFNPDQNVTRNEMAVVMSNLMEYNVATYANTSPFTDVPSWAEPYVAACWTNGITAGTSATTYGGSENVTTAQAALMIMKALGYFQYQQDFGSDWQLATISKGNDISLFDDVNSGVREAMTRNDVAQLVLNALEAGTVTASTNGSFTVGDVTVATSIEYNYVTSNQDYARAISDLRPGSSTSSTEGYIVELGERLYQGDLEKEESTDDFMRPATMWTYNSREVGTFADEADTTWTSTVSERDLYQAAGSAAYNSYDWYVYRNGVVVDNWDGVDGSDVISSRTSTDRWNQSGSGVLTEVYVDNTDREVVVTQIDTFVAEVTRVEDEGDGEYTVTISYKSDRPSGSETEFVTEQEFNRGDIVVVTIGDTEIQSMAVAETVTGTVTGVKSNDYVRIDGTTYNYNRIYTSADAPRIGAGLVNLDDGDKYTNPDVDNDVTIYLDTYGNAVAIEGAQDSIDDYLYVTGVDTAYGDWSVKAVFADGTERTLDIDEIDGENASSSNRPQENTIYKWSQSGNSYDLETSTYGEFTVLTWDQGANGYGNGDIKRDRASIYDGDTRKGTADEDTVFVHVDDSKVWTGYNTVPSMTGVYGAAVEDDGIITVMFIGDSQGSTAEDDDFVYISDTGYETVNNNGDTLYQYHGSYINQDGSLVSGEFIASSNLSNTIRTEGLYQVLNRDSDDYATSVRRVVNAVDPDDFNQAYATRASGGILVLKGTNYDLTSGSEKDSYRYNSNTFFMVVELKAGNDDTDRVYEGSVSDIETWDDSRNADNSDLTGVYVVTVDDEGDDTPLANMVLVIVPDEDTDSAQGGGNINADDYAITRNGLALEVVVASGASSTDSAIVDAVEAWLTDNVGTVTDITTTDNGYSFRVGNRTYTLDMDNDVTKNGVKIRLDGTDMLVASNTTLTSLGAEGGYSYNGTDYVANTGTVVANTTYVSGYYKLTVNAGTYTATIEGLDNGEDAYITAGSSVDLTVTGENADWTADGGWTVNAPDGWTISNRYVSNSDVSTLNVTLTAPRDLESSNADITVELEAGAL